MAHPKIKKKEANWNPKLIFFKKANWNQGAFSKKTPKTKKQTPQGERERSCKWAPQTSLKTSSPLTPDPCAHPLPSLVSPLLRPPSPWRPPRSPSSRRLRWRRRHRRRRCRCRSRPLRPRRYHRRRPPWSPCPRSRWPWWWQRRSPVAWTSWRSLPPPSGEDPWPPSWRALRFLFWLIRAPPGGVFRVIWFGCVRVGFLVNAGRRWRRARMGTGASIAPARSRDAWSCKKPLILFDFCSSLFHTILGRFRHFSEKKGRGNGNVWYHAIFAAMCIHFG